MKDKVLNIVKKYYKPAILCLSVIAICLISTESSKDVYVSNVDNKTLTMVRTKEDDAIKQKAQEKIREDIIAATVVFDGLTMDELAKKLDRNLSSTLSGRGRFIAEYSTKIGLDPYLAVAIMLHETGCSWSCSGLARQCNNFGGQKGSPSCGGSSYRSYPTVEAGLKGMMDNLNNNYYQKGLRTPEQINSRYAESKAWSGKINSYMNRIKAS